MPRKRKASGDFPSAFDDELGNIETPEDSLTPPEAEIKTNIEKKPVSSEADISEAVSPDVKKESTGNKESKFGFSLRKDQDVIETVNKTYKISDYTARKLDSLVHSDSKNTKKISGTKGFLSDFLENAIWQHFLQLGLIDEEEANEHIKDYSKYPINIENFNNIKK
ncbi:hypothetical protein [Enterococcus sp. HY326]|uniref:hypothetical protein n=1 Tax=Enterococcus sp. HY326 TaxID=2971265 RepID=UPI0022402233|nr:hypothetical protein [Enterococcus sp. HY326]